MTVKKRGIILWIVTVCVMTLLSGCFFRTPEDLYQSPERSADYLSLTQTIKDVKNALAQEYGAEVNDTSVMSGDNTALVQLQDLDGDMVRETAVTFFRIPEAEKPLKICFFTKTAEDTYQMSAVVEGNGSAIYRVDYVDLDGSGHQEVVVSWQMGTGSYLLGAYSIEEPVEQNINRISVGEVAKAASAPPVQQEKTLDLKKYRAAELLSTAYSGYTLCDIDEDTRNEIAIARVGIGGTGSTVEIYGYQDGAFVVESTAPLSSGIESLEKNGVKQNYIGGSVPVRAIYVSSKLQDGRHVVDILSYQNSQFVNISLGEQGISVEHLDRYVDLEPSDVNADGILELPVPSVAPSAGDLTASDFWLIDWYQYTANGGRVKMCTTFHNISDGWYIIIPDNWKNQIVLRRNDSTSGQRAVIFYHKDGENEEPFLVIYKFTSQFERATLSNRFELRRESDAVYGAAFYEIDWDWGMSEVDLQAAFHLIQSDWED